MEYIYLVCRLKVSQLVKKTSVKQCQSSRENNLIMEENISCYIVTFIIIYFLLDGQDYFNDSTFPSLGKKKHMQIALVGKFLPI